MYVVVMGLGQVGRHLVEMLEWEHHDVVCIDQDPEVIAQIADRHDVATLVGYGANDKLLRQAGVDKADLVVAVSSIDEVNIITALASRALGAKKVVARVQGEAWSDTSEGVTYGQLGVDVVINPRLLLAQEIAKIARSHGALEVIDLANDRLELVQVGLSKGCRMLRRPISKLEMPANTLIAAIVRNGVLSVPGGADVLRPGDRIYLLGRRENIERAEDMFTAQRQARSACVVGGGVIGKAVARDLSNDGAKVLLIEADAKRAELVAQDLPNVTVLHGDGTNLELLKEEHAGDFDLFVATSHDDEVNLMSCLLAQRVGDARTICVVHRPDYMEIYKQLGIDIVLSPRLVASDHILRYTRTSDLRSLTVLEHGQAEVLEIEARADSRAVGTPVRRLNVPRGALLAALVRDDAVIIPNGDDMIQAGDTVIVLTTTRARPAIARMFKKKAL
ncbi:MAG: trk system potassium uptake protein TrkA [Kiritimatiellia bacterium]|jgi:trk system potassium uptake protein TrkA